MNLNLTNLKDLEYICELAANSIESRDVTPKEIEWLQRIAKYRQLFQAEIYRLEAHELGLKMILKTSFDSEPSETMIEAGWLKAIEMGATGPEGLQDQKAMFILGFRLGWRYRWVNLSDSGSDKGRTETQKKAQTG